MQRAIAREVSSAEPEVDNLGSLIPAMRRGEERALEQLYDATVGKLFALAVAILRNVDDAEEVVCSTYAYAWSSAASYSTERGAVLGWLLMLCRSRALDRLRQRREADRSVDISALQLEDEGPAPDDLLQHMQQRSRIHAALETLTPEQRRLLSLAFFSGMSHQEISAATQKPLGTVKSHLRRALAQLREELEAM